MLCPYRSLFPNVKTIDAKERPGHPLDYIGDVHHLPMIGDAMFDVVLCTEVLEHLHSPHEAIAEFRRILKPGGMLILSTRFVFPLHETPVDYFRYTRYGLEFLLKEFEIVELKEETNTMETFAVLCQRMGFQCTTLWARPFKLGWFLLAKLFLWFPWILTEEYGDIHQGHVERPIMSSGYYVAARKK
jgi:SAM-dependent methyltransferase